jgi:hypothetical protein
MLLKRCCINFLRLFLLLFCLSLFSCSGDSGTNNPRAAQVVVGIHHLQASKTMLVVALRFDGSEIDRFTSTVGTEPVGLQGRVADLRTGRHTVEVVVIQQTSSPNQYLINGSLIVEGRQILLNQTSGTVATGQSLVTTFDF